MFYRFNKVFFTKILEHSRCTLMSASFVVRAKLSQKDVEKKWNKEGTEWGKTQKSVCERYPQSTLEKLCEA